MFCAEGPRHTPVQLCLNHLGLQHANFRVKCSGRQMMQLRAEALEACPHDTGLWFDFEREIQRFLRE